MRGHMHFGIALMASVCLLAWLATGAEAQNKNNKNKNKNKNKNNGANITNNVTPGAKANAGAIRDLQEALGWLREANPLYDGHRGAAYAHLRDAISELNQAGGKSGKKPGKVVKKGPTKTPVVKLKDNNALPAGWEISNSQMQSAAKMIVSGMGKIQSKDGHGQAAAAHCQLALAEINSMLNFMNSITIKKKTR